MLATRYYPNQPNPVRPLIQKSSGIGQGTPLILMLGTYDWANVGFRLAEAINRYTNWRARVIIEKLHPFKYNHDMLAHPNHLNEIKSLMEEADYVLYLSSFYKTAPLKLNPPATTPRGIWHGGSFFRKQHSMFEYHVHPQMDHVFAHRDLENLTPRIIRLHAPYDTDNHTFTPKKFDGKIRIGHSPSIKAQKGTSYFEKAIVPLQKLFPNQLEFVTISGVGWKQCIEQKRNLHIFFDQIAGYHIPPKATHGYGVSLLEAAAFGTVCLCGCNYPDTPIQHVQNTKDIINAVSKFVNNRKLLKGVAERTRNWVEREHGYEAVATKFIKSISQGVANKKNAYEKIRTVVQKKKGNYIFGRVNFFEFAKSNPIEGFVNVGYIRDVPAMQLERLSAGHRAVLKLIQSKEKKKIALTDYFITVSHAAADAIKKYIFGSKAVDYDIYMNYPNYIKTVARKRDEIVFIDNSTCSHDNYDRLLLILNQIQSSTGKKCIFISQFFHEEAQKESIKNKTNVHVMNMSDYDFNSKYGVLIDALDPLYARISIPRKFLLYLMCGMVPIIHKRFEECIEYLQYTKINHVIYHYAGDLKELNIQPNHDGKMFCLEYNYLKMIDILRKINAHAPPNKKKGRLSTNEMPNFTDI